VSDTHGRQGIRGAVANVLGRIAQGTLQGRSRLANPQVAQGFTGIPADRILLVAKALDERFDLSGMVQHSQGAYDRLPDTGILILQGAGQMFDRSRVTQVAQLLGRRVPDAGVPVL